MSAHVYVCDGCCCGRTEKGHKEVPADLLRDAWKKHDLAQEVYLTISSCLGPCRMHNVTLVSTEEGRTWLGKLSTESHYQALVQWATETAQAGSNVPLPSVLLDHRFDPNE